MHGKGAKQRMVPLNKSAREALSLWQRHRPEDFDTDAYFVGQRDDPISTSTLYQIITDLAYHAQVEATPHVLRHTFAKRLVDQGVSLEKVAALLGHESLDTTSTYLTPSKHVLEEAVRTLEY